MNPTTCPLCGESSLEEKHGAYQFEPPSNVPGGTIVIEGATWQACGNCGEEILPHELSKAIEAERCQRLGLLSAAEIREVRERTGLSAVDMAQLLGVGDKTYTRWETGRSIQNKSNDTLIRLIDQHAHLFALVDAERDPNRGVTISHYIRDLGRVKANNPFAIAAHGGELSRVVRESIRQRLREIRAVQKDSA